jgi:SEC-C motif-containing protein
MEKYKMETTTENCPCGSGTPYANCCRPLIEGAFPAPTPEALMRSRYTAFAKTKVQYLLDTVHPQKRKDHDAASIRKWSEKSIWRQLTIKDTQEGGAEDNQGTVEFIAEYIEKGTKKRHHEIAKFKKQDDKWYFYDGEAPEQKQVVRSAPKIGRNDPCHCGSGKKFKKCCGK